ncbi:hypothetical protein E2C01_101167 [Portunus trituberculatus]|uniref:Uncharacterized protein n=1 Tax=Portunus trituberculatus TaxID=210409 RepID=A0A5B7KFF6_PORTR|nr:hypothetical protein [Portunus trituberculatus]
MQPPRRVTTPCDAIINAWGLGEQHGAPLQRAVVLTMGVDRGALSRSCLTEDICMRMGYELPGCSSSSRGSY